MINASYKMNEDGTFERMEGSDETSTESASSTAPEQEVKCSTCAKKSEPCISFFAYENSMMHKDVDNERLHETIREQARESNRRNLCLCATFIVIILLFVVTDTVRTNIWNETVRNMTAAIVELANAKGIAVP